MIRIIIAAALFALPAVALAGEWLTGKALADAIAANNLRHAADHVSIDGRYGAPIALPADEDAVRMQRIGHSMCVPGPESACHDGHRR